MTAAPLKAGSSAEIYRLTEITCHETIIHLTNTLIMMWATQRRALFFER